MWLSSWEQQLVEEECGGAKEAQLVSKPAYLHVNASSWRVILHLAAHENIVRKAKIGMYAVAFRAPSRVPLPTTSVGVSD